VFRFGEPAENLYLLLSGEVKVLDHVMETLEGESNVVDTLTPGSIFGEYALLEEKETRRR
jgi:CRP-like cAMP-binding protein